ncbi:ABC transporter permease [Streptomyces sp. NPDC058001]|uniref:ABC transporter permease n=1 Tax=Streptomyces sp. NPDC058001 TaxID=3346300 RepID=UPI0036F109EA
MRAVRVTSTAGTTRTTAPGFKGALFFEWTKFMSLRSTRWTYGASGLVTVAGAVFVGVSGSLQPDDTVLGGSLTLGVISLMIAGVVGALVICGEYTGGTIASTLVAVPRRSRVIAAKAALLSALLYAVSLASCALAYVLGNAILADGVYAQGEPFPALFGIAGLFSVVGVLGMAVGVLLRHSAGSVAAVIALLLLPSLLGPLFGDARRWVVGATPTAALEKLTQTSDASPEAVGTLGAWPSLWLVAGYTALLLLAAAWRLGRRDA